jgi:hypothetical protein
MENKMNEIKLKNKREQFNICLQYYQKSNDESLTSEEREKYIELWAKERIKFRNGTTETYKPE